MTIARMTAKTGVKLLSTPAIFVPMRRLDSKFSSAATPGKSNPITANRTTAFRLPSLGSTKNGARHQNSSVEVGMLIATPTHGSVHRNPNWVSTKPAPNPNIEARAKKIAVVIGAVPHERLDRGSSAGRFRTMRKYRTVTSAEAKTADDPRVRALRCSASRCPWAGKDAKLRTQI